MIRWIKNNISDLIFAIVVSFVVFVGIWYVFAVASWVENGAPISVRINEKETIVELNP